MCKDSENQKTAADALNYHMKAGLGSVYDKAPSARDVQIQVIKSKSDEFRQFLASLRCDIELLRIASGKIVEAEMWAIKALTA